MKCDTVSHGSLTPAPWSSRAPELSHRPVSPAETLSSSKLNKLFQSPISSLFFHSKPQATANCHTMNSVSPLINEEKTGENLHLIRESSSFINYHFLANTSLSSCLRRSEIFFFQGDRVWAQ